MTEDETARRLVAAEIEVHQRGGVWWETVVPFYCKPVDPMRALRPGSVRPSRRRSLLGYSHVVSDADQANHSWTVMLLGEEALASFSISSLKSSKRARVRKGLRSVRVEPIEDMNAVLPDMRDINVAQAQRTGHGKLESWYTEHEAAWRKTMLALFAIPGRWWWGAFDGERLIAYYYAYCIAGTAYFSAAKSHTEYLKLCPNDALCFSLLEMLRDREDTQRVVFGDASPEAAGLTRFKELFGFHATELPVYRHYNPVVTGLQRVAGDRPRELYLRLKAKLG